MAGGHEEAVPFLPAKTKVGDRFRQVDFANQRAVGGKDVNAIIAVPGPAGAGPDITVHITTYAVGQTFANVAEKSAVRQPLALNHIIDHNPGRRRASIGDIQQAVVRREAQAVGFFQFINNNGRFPRFRVKPVNGFAQFKFRLMALIIAHNAVARVGEPDAAILMDNDIIGGVQFPALVIVHQDRNPAVILRSRYPPAVMFAGNETAVTIPGITIAVVRRAAKDRHLPRFFQPAQHPVIRNIAPEQKTAVAKPDRPLRPTRPGPQTLQSRAAQHIPLEARIEHLNSRVGITNQTITPISIH